MPFGNGEAELLDDLDDLHEKLSLALNLRRLEPCADRSVVAQRSAVRLLGDIGISSVVSTPTAAVLDDHHEAAIVLLQQGRIDHRLAGRQWTAEAGRTALYLSGEAMKVRTRFHTGIVYNLNPALLARYLLEHERTLTLETALQALQRPWRIDLRDPATRAAQQHLQLIIHLLDGTGELQPSASILTLLQDRLYQVSAQLLLPALRRG